MDDYISREMAIKRLEYARDAMGKDTVFGVGHAAGLDVAINHIKDLPAADVRPVVRGEWRKSKLFNDHPECPVCFYVSGDRSNFCPCCGADMRGGTT